VLTPPEEKKKFRDLLGCLGCEGDKARKCARSLQIPTFCFVVSSALWSMVEVENERREKSPLARM